MAQQLVESVEYKISVSGQQAALQAIKSLKANQDALNKTFDTLSATAPTSVQRVRDRFTTLGKSVADDIGFVKKLGSELENLDGTEITTTVKTEEIGSSGGRSGPGRLGSLGREIKALPSIDLGPVSTDQIGKIFQTVDTGLTALGATTTQVAAASGAAAPALIALSLAVDVFTKGVTAGKTLLEAAFSAQEIYYNALKNSTTEEVVAQVEELTRVQPILRQQLEETGRATGTNSDRYKQQAQLLEVNEQAITRLNQGLAEDAFFTNDVRQRIEEANKANEEAARLTDEMTQARFRETRQMELSAFQFERNLDVQVAALQRTGTLSGVDDRVASLQSESAAIQENIGELRELARTNSLAAEELKKTETRLSEMRTEAARLASIRPEVAMRELADATKDLNEDLAKLNNARVSKLSELATDLQADLAEAAQAFSEDQQKNAEKRIEELEKFNREEEQRTDQHRRNIAAIERKFDVSAESAIADRDAAAYDAALTAKKEALAEEDERYKLENEKRAQDLKDLKASLDKEDKQTADAYQKRYNALVQQNQREVSAVNAKYQADVQVRQQAFNIEAQQLQAAINQEITMRNFLNNAIYNGTALLVQRVAALYNGLTLPSPDTKEQGLMKTFASGGRFSAGTTALVGEKGPEIVHFDRAGRVFNNQQSQAMANGSGGSPVYNFTAAFNGTDRRTMRRNFIQWLNEELDAAEQEAGR